MLEVLFMSKAFFSYCLFCVEILLTNRQVISLTRSNTTVATRHQTGCCGVIKTVWWKDVAFLVIQDGNNAKVLLFTGLYYLNSPLTSTLLAFDHQTLKQHFSCLCVAHKSNRAFLECGSNSVPFQHRVPNSKYKREKTPPNHSLM